MKVWIGRKCTVRWRGRTAGLLSKPTRLDPANAWGHGQDREGIGDDGSTTRAISTCQRTRGTAENAFESRVTLLSAMAGANLVTTIVKKWADPPWCLTNVV